MQFESVTDRSVTVLWAPPEQQNGVLTGYSLRWTVDGSPETLVERNVTAEVTRLQVDHLQVRPEGTWRRRANRRRREAESVGGQQQ